MHFSARFPTPNVRHWLTSSLACPVKRTKAVCKHKRYEPAFYIVYLPSSSFSASLLLFFHFHVSFLFPSSCSLAIYSSSGSIISQLTLALRPAPADERTLGLPSLHPAGPGVSDYSKQDWSREKTHFSHQTRWFKKNTTRTISYSWKNLKIHEVRLFGCKVPTNHNPKSLIQLPSLPFALHPRIFLVSHQK